MELEQHYRAWLQPPRTQPQQPQQAARSGSKRSSGRGASAAGIPSHSLSGAPDVLAGSTPPLGSSPISGSLLERAAHLHLQQHPPGSSPGGSQLLSHAADLAARRQQQASALQAPRRPTSVPAWLDGSAGEPLLPQVSGRLLAHASQAALAAIGHLAPPGAGAAASGAAGQGVSAAAAAASRHHSAAFRPSGQEDAAEAQAAVAKLARNLGKKLQQVEALEQRAAAVAAGVTGAVPLDAQQQAKLCSKATLTEALHVSASVSQLPLLALPDECTFASASGGGLQFEC